MRLLVFFFNFRFLQLLKAEQSGAGPVRCRRMTLGFLGGTWVLPRAGTLRRQDGQSFTGRRGPGCGKSLRRRHQGGATHSWRTHVSDERTQNFAYALIRWHKDGLSRWRTWRKIICFEPNGPAYWNVWRMEESVLPAWASIPRGGIVPTINSRRPSRRIVSSNLNNLNILHNKMALIKVCSALLVFDLTQATSRFPDL